MSLTVDFDDCSVFCASSVRSDASFSAWLASGRSFSALSVRSFMASRVSSNSSMFFTKSDIFSAARSIVSSIRIKLGS